MGCGLRLLGGPGGNSTGKRLRGCPSARSRRRSAGGWLPYCLAGLCRLLRGRSRGFCRSRLSCLGRSLRRLGRGSRGHRRSLRCLLWYRSRLSVVTVRPFGGRRSRCLALDSPLVLLRRPRGGCGLSLAGLCRLREEHGVRLLRRKHAVLSGVRGS